jgi:hypothetical protein
MQWTDQVASFGSAVLQQQYIFLLEKTYYLTYTETPDLTI